MLTVQVIAVKEESVLPPARLWQKTGVGLPVFSVSPQFLGD
jgi:hypothetical protein